MILCLPGRIVSARIARLQAGVAQLVEQLICNQPVGGSNPFASPTRVSWSGAPDSDSVLWFGSRREKMFPDGSPQFSGV